VKPAALGSDAEAVFGIEGPTESRVPFVAVGFRGLVIESGAYVCELTGKKAQSAEGLFAFCLDLTYFARNVLTADVDVKKYFV
jgi:hypothetical protein